MPHRVLKVPERGMLDAYELPDDVRHSIDRGAAEALFPRLAAPASMVAPAPRQQRPHWWSGATGDAPAARRVLGLGRGNRAGT